jgi:DNA-binding MarR family transcriptional regulator
MHIHHLDMDPRILRTDCLASKARMTARAITAIYDRALAHHGLTAGQLNLLAAIAGHGPCAPSALGDALVMERSTVSRNLAVLLGHGWIEAAESDGKGVRTVVITAAGTARLTEAMPGWSRAQAEARRLLGPDGVAAMHAVSAAIRGPGAAGPGIPD